MNKNIKLLIESFFDDIEDNLYNDEDNSDTVMSSITQASVEIPMLKKLIDTLVLLDKNQI